MTQRILLCRSEHLREADVAVPFEVSYIGQPCRAFAIRYLGQVHAYLNRCSHVPMEMDCQPNHFFDFSKTWLICSTHGALYDPCTGRCRMGPCRGGLIKIAVDESDGVVHWHTAAYLTTRDT